MNKNVLVIGLVVILVAVGGVLLLAQKQKPASVVKQAVTTVTPTVVPISPTVVPATTATPSGTGVIEKIGAVKEFTVTGSSFAFAPNKLTVKKGDKVKIVFKSSGGMHDFVIDRLNVRTKVIQEGQTETVEFTADKIGTFEYYCSVGNHRKMGMIGSLVVE